MEEVARRGIRIECDVVLDTELLDELNHQVVVSRPVDRDAQDAETAVAIALVDGLQIGRLLAAGVAPGGPEVDQQDVSVVVGEGDGGTVVQ